LEYYVYSSAMMIVFNIRYMSLQLCLSSQVMAEEMGKQRLRPFLEAQINNGRIDGLRWLNDEKTKFRIPWWHGGKPEWNPKHGQIFKVHRASDGF